MSTSPIGKTKADLAFCKKLRELQVEAAEFGWNERTSANTEQLFLQYGMYLELVSTPMDPVQEHQFLYEFTWQKLNLPSKELIFVGHNEPTVIEEQMHVLSGGAAEAEAFPVYYMSID